MTWGTGVDEFPALALAGKTVFHLDQSKTNIFPGRVPLPATVERNVIEILGLKTFYLKAGPENGRPIFMLHGGSPGTCANLNWKHNIDALAAAGFVIYAFDQPGFGDTAVPTDHSMEFRVAHAIAFVKAISAASFDLAGNSMGAYIAARIALEFPKAGRLVLISSSTLAPKGSDAAQAKSDAHNADLRSYQPSLENMRALTKNTFLRQEMATEEVIRERYEMSAGARHEAAQARLKAAPARSMVPDLPKLTMESLILWGANDHGAAVERALLLFQALPKAELHVFNNCAHWVHWDQAERFNNLVTGFLSRRL